MRSLTLSQAHATAAGTLSLSRHICPPAMSPVIIFIFHISVCYIYLLVCVPHCMIHGAAPAKRPSPTDTHRFKRTSNLSTQQHIQLGKLTSRAANAPFMSMYSRCSAANLGASSLSAMGITKLKESTRAMRLPRLIPFCSRIIARITMMAFRRARSMRSRQC